MAAERKAAAKQKAAKQKAVAKRKAVTDLKHLDKKKLLKAVEESWPYLDGVRDGSTVNARHTEYWSKSSCGARREMDFGMVHTLSIVTDDQVMTIADLMIERYTFEEYDYIYRVLIPECLVHMYATIEKISHREAENNMLRVKRKTADEDDKQLSKLKLKEDSTREVNLEIIEMIKQTKKADSSQTREDPPSVERQAVDDNAFKKKVLEALRNLEEQTVEMNDKLDTLVQLKKKRKIQPNTLTTHQPNTPSAAKKQPARALFQPSPGMEIQPSPSAENQSSVESQMLNAANHPPSALYMQHPSASYQPESALSWLPGAPYQPYQSVSSQLPGAPYQPYQSVSSQLPGAPYQPHQSVSSQLPGAPYQPNQSVSSQLPGAPYQPNQSVSSQLPGAPYQPPPSPSPSSSNGTGNRLIGAPWRQVSVPAAVIDQVCAEENFGKRVKALLVAVFTTNEIVTNNTLGSEGLGKLDENKLSAIREHLATLQPANQAVNPHQAPFTIKVHSIINARCRRIRYGKGEKKSGESSTSP
ncbi:Hypp9376 [Branchiostoma lanceolatum]|nr:Hypp9376 [Branchiostoma lanceolatum]